MTEVAYQNQSEKPQTSPAERQMFDQAQKFEIKQLGRTFIDNFDLGNEEFTQRIRNQGRKLDDAFVGDFSLARKISSTLRTQLVNNFGFDAELDFRSFKIVSGEENNVYAIDKHGVAHECFGVGKDIKPSLSSDTVTIKYYKDIKKEPKFTFQNVKYDCREVFEIIREPKKGIAQKIILRNYQINGKQYVTYDWMHEEEKKPKNPKNYSKINS